MGWDDHQIQISVPVEITPIKLNPFQKYPISHDFPSFLPSLTAQLFSCPDKSPRQLYTYPCHSLTTYKEVLLFDIQTPSKSDPRALWPFRHLIRVMRGHGATNKKTITKTKTMTKTSTLRQRLSRAILETCDIWDIWSGWWGDMTWPTKKRWQRQRQR